MRVSEQMLRDGVERMCRVSNHAFRLDGAYAQRTTIYDRCAAWKITRKHAHGGYEDVFQIGYVPKKTIMHPKGGVWYSIDAYLRGYNDAFLQR